MIENILKEPVAEEKVVHYKVSIGTWEGIEVRLYYSFWDLSAEDQSKLLLEIQQERKIALQSIEDSKLAHLNAKIWAHNLNPFVLDNLSKYVMDGAIVPISNSGVTSAGHSLHRMRNGDYSLYNRAELANEHRNNNTSEQV